MKKFILSFLFSFIAVNIVSAQETVIINDIKYYLEDGEAIIMAQTESLPYDIVIPSIVSYKGVDYKVTGLVKSAFYGYDITSIVLPEGITELPEQCFACCKKLTSITLPNSITAIGNDCFVKCGLSSIKLPDNLKTIGYCAFWYCVNLKSITLPKSITSLGDMCFDGCTSLMKVKCEWDKLDGVSISESAFSNIFPMAKLYVPKGKSAVYRAKKQWNSFKRIIEFDDVSDSAEQKPQSPSMMGNQDAKVCEIAEQNPQSLSMTENQDAKVYEIAEQLPQYPGGMAEMKKWFSSNIQYPAMAKENGIQGKAIVSFVVETDGTITGAKIVKSVEPSLDNEALRLVTAMPKWTPGRQEGKAVRVRYTAPVIFRL